MIEPATQTPVELAEGICERLHKRILNAARTRSDKERERLMSEYIQAIERLRAYSI